MYNLYPGWKIVLPALRVRNMKPLRTLGNYAINAQGGRSCNRRGGRQEVLGPGKGRENMQGYPRWLCSAHQGLSSRGFFIVKLYVWKKKTNKQKKKPWILYFKVVLDLWLWCTILSLSEVSASVEDGIKEIMTALSSLPESVVRVMEYLFSFLSL